MKEPSNYLAAVKGNLEQKCRSCECLQGFLAQLKADYGSARPPEVDEMLVPRKEQHRCLGCNPCPPADIFACYIKDKKA